MKILIADDDPQILRALRITLSARGYDVLTASDGREALRLAADGHPDIIVVDLGMPGLTGIEVIEAVRGDRDRLLSEGADALYHLLVMCAARGVTLSDLEAELGRREGTSGLAEKAGRG